LVGMWKVGNVKYCFDLRSNFGEHMLKLDR
jgi:hypothetical protein